VEYKQPQVHGSLLLENVGIKNHIKTLTQAAEDGRIATAIERQRAILLVVVLPCGLPPDARQKSRT
jgi:hypothetical protein